MSKRERSPKLNIADMPNKRSVGITNQNDIDNFTEDQNNTFLVSFPRTGSHWLRMMMELYFEQPSLMRVFYYSDSKDYLTLHTHDLELDIVRTRVIYLYRNPVETVFSQLHYHQEDINDHSRISYWSDLYGRHLDKWLHQEEFTVQKTVIKYEHLKTDMQSEFEKICSHFSAPLDSERINNIAEHVSKDRVQAMVSHDPQAMNLSKAYQNERTNFSNEHGDLIWRELLHGREHLRDNFKA